MQTIIGSGGAGKTRLAMQAGADIIDDFANGVYIAEFAPVSDSSLIVQTLLNSLNQQEEPEKSPKEILKEYLKDKELLLILDNCEHLVHECAELSEMLLKSCVKLKIIATRNRKCHDILKLENEIAEYEEEIKTFYPEPEELEKKLAPYHAMYKNIENNREQLKKKNEAMNIPGIRDLKKEYEGIRRDFTYRVYKENINFNLDQIKYLQSKHLSHERMN